MAERGADAAGPVVADVMAAGGAREMGIMRDPCTTVEFLLFGAAKTHDLTDMQVAWGLQAPRTMTRCSVWVESRDAQVR